MASAFGYTENNVEMRETVQMSRLYTLAFWSSVMK